MNTGMTYVHACVFRIIHVLDKRPEYGEGIWYGKIIADKSAYL